MKKVMAWIKASRIPAQAFIFPSLLLGQIISFSIYGKFSWFVFAFVHLYGLLMHLFIVYANDYADYETDKLNKTFTPFTGGSRVLVDGSLTKENMLFGTIITAIMCLIMGLFLSYFVGNWLILALVTGGMILLHAYSFRPMQISYKGYGELLQMTGVGVVLPLIGFLAQGGNIEVFPWLIIIIILPSQLAMAISTSLPDEPSDRLSFKRTTVVILGHDKSKFLMILLYSISLISILIYQKFLFINLYALIIGLLVFALIFSQFFMSLKYSTKPGSTMIFYVVLLSILTNTIMVLGMSYILFLT